MITIATTEQNQSLLLEEKVNIAYIVVIRNVIIYPKCMVCSFDI